MRLDHMSMVAALVLASDPSPAAPREYLISGRGRLDYDVSPTWTHKSPGASVDPGGKHRKARRLANKAARKARARNRK